jgi:hypothetical protein
VLFLEKISLHNDDNCFNPSSVLSFVFRTPRGGQRAAVMVTVYARVARAALKGGLGGGGVLPPNENTSRQSDLFHYSLEGPNFTYGKQILHNSQYSIHANKIYITTYNTI